MPKAEAKAQKLAAEKLAALVLQVLDTQQEYYRTKRTELLHECKRMEKNLRASAKAILFPPIEERPGLFDELPDEATA